MKTKYLINHKGAGLYLDKRGGGGRGRGEEERGCLQTACKLSAIISRASPAEWREPRGAGGTLSSAPPLGDDQSTTGGAGRWLRQQEYVLD